MTASRPVRQWPEPGRGWIAWAPSTWSCGPGIWTDLSRARLEGHRPARDRWPDLDVSSVDDLLYLPPVREELRDERDRRAAEWVEEGLAVLVQIQPGEACEVEGTRKIVDLLPALLEGDVDALGAVPRGTPALWPLVPGLTDRPELQEEGCALLGSRGGERVQVVVPEIPVPIRRRLAEASSDAFDALFHPGTITERELVRTAWRHGLFPFLARSPVGSARTVRNREIAEVLALVAELTIRLGQPMAEAQVILRAARGAEASSRDLAALVREGNLRVLDWLDPRAAEIVEELVVDETASRLDELMESYVEGAAPGRSPQTLS